MLPFVITCIPFFLSTVQSLALDVPQLSQIAPAISFNTSKTPDVSTPSLSDISSASAKDLADLMIQCDPAKYGDNLIYDSCFDAYRQIPRSVQLISFGSRVMGNWDVHFPLRFLSCKWKETQNKYMFRTQHANRHTQHDIEKQHIGTWSPVTDGRYQRTACALLTLLHDPGSPSPIKQHISTSPKQRTS